MTIVRQRDALVDILACQSVALKPAVARTDRHATFDRAAGIGVAARRFAWSDLAAAARRDRTGAAYRGGRSRAACATSGLGRWLTTRDREQRAQRNETPQPKSKHRQSRERHTQYRTHTQYVIQNAEQIIQDTEDRTQES